jgi:sn-glycerol 3-phosphate transport system substrate-binding protein
MKKWNKLIASILMVMLIVTSLTGCKTSTTDEGNKTPDQGITEETKDTIGEGSLVPTEPTEVIFWHSISGNNEKVLTELVDAYNAGPGNEKGITVKAIFQGAYDEFSTKLAASLQAGDVENLPDIVQLSSKGIFDIKDSKYIYPVQNLLDKDPEGIKTASFNAASAAYCTYSGDLLGVPFSTSSIMMYYNKDHFKEAGLDPEAPPATIAELATAVEKLTVKNGEKINRFGLGTKLRFFILGTWIPSIGNGSAMFNNANGRTGTPTEITMTKDGSLEKTLTEWSAVLATGGVEYTDAGPNESFLSGYYSMIFGSTSSMANFVKTAKDNGMDLGVAELPRVDENGSPATGIGGSALYMFNRNNENSVLATWDFIKYLASPEASAKWFMGTGYYPMNTDAFNLDDVKALMEDYPQYKIISTIITNSAGYTDYTEPWIPSFTDTDTLVQDEIIKFSDGTQDISKTIENIHNGATIKLEDFISAN